MKPRRASVGFSFGFRMGFWGAVLALGLGLLPAPSARAQDDDWSITRPDRPRGDRPRGDRPRGDRPRGDRPRGDRPRGDDGAGRGPAALRERYLGIVLSDPRDGFAMDRLLSLYREGEGSLDGLTTLLAQRLLTESGATRNAISLVLARLAREAGDLGAARQRYEEVLAAAPGHWIAELGLFALDRAAGELAASRSHLERALASAPTGEREELARTLGELCLDLSDYEGAARAYGELGRGARSVHLRGEFARALAARGEHERAVAAYQTIVSEVAGDRRVVPPLLVEIARAQLQLGRLEDAIATLERARSAAAPSAGIRGEIAELMLDAQRRRGTLETLVTDWSGARGAEERLTVARALDELGRDAEAVAAYRRAIGARPRDLEGRLGEIRVLLRSGDIDAAIESYRALIRIAPRPQHVIALAELLEAHGRRDEALAITDRLVSSARAADVSTLDALAALFSRWHDDARATRALSRRAELSPLDPVPLVALGDQLLALGDQEGALRTFRRILSLGGDEAAAHAALGAVYLDHDRLADAVTELETAIRLRRERGTPVEVETLRLLATTHERASDQARAEAAWREVLAAAEGDPSLAREAREHIVSSWARGRALDAHIASLRAAFDATPPDLEAGRFLVEALRRRRDLALAVSTLRRLDELAPGDVGALELLERLEVQRGDLSGAIDALERLARAEPRRAAERHRRMAEHALDLYRDDDALTYARRAVELAPEEADGWARLSELWRSRGDLPQAAQALRRAVELDPRRYELAITLADLDVSRGELGSAESLLLSVVSGSPDDTLVTEAVRAILDLHSSSRAEEGASLAPLESALLAQVLRSPERVALRRAFVDLLQVRVTALRSHDDPESVAERTRMVTRGLAPLLLAIASSDPIEAAAAIELVRIARVPGAAGTLLARAEGAGDAAARLEALATLAPLAGPAHARRIAALTTTGDVAFRALATWTLARALGSDRTALERAILPLLDDPEREVRAFAALAIGGTSAAPSLAVVRAARSQLEASSVDLPLIGWAFSRALPEEVAARFGAPGAAASPLVYRALSRTGAPSAQRVLLSALLDPLLRDTATAALLSGVVLEASVDPRPGESAQAFLMRALGTREVDLPALEPLLTQVLLGALGASDEATTTRALEILLPARSGAPGVTVAGLSAPSSEVRLSPAALSALDASLLALAHAPSVGVRTRAVALLAAGSRSNDATLFSLALEDAAPSVIRAALEARGAIGVTAELEPILSRALSEHPDWAVRVLAASALARGTSGDTEAALLHVAQGDPFALVRDAAVRALSQRADLRPSTRVALLELCVNDPEPRVREAIEGWLGCN